MDSTYKVFQYDKWTPDLNPVSFQPFNSISAAEDYMYDYYYEEFREGGQFLIIEFLDDNTSKIVKTWGI